MAIKNQVLTKKENTVLIVFTLLICVSLHFISIYMAVACFSYFCLLFGMFFRKKQKIHASLMSLGIAIDLIIVLSLEIQRHAVETALSFKLSILQQLHIASSSIATLLYFPLILLGVLHFLKRGNIKTRLIHKFLGITAFTFRSLGFILMFSLLWKKH